MRIFMVRFLCLIALVFVGVIAPAISKADGVSFAPGFAGASTWANIPSAAGYTNRDWRVTDMGDLGGLIVYSDGTNWRTRGKQTILQSNIPFVFPAGTGSAGFNFTSSSGAFSWGTGFASVGIPSAAYFYLPNGIPGVAGSTAGWYYAVPATTTTGTIYNNKYTGGSPVIPASPTAVTGVTTGYITQTTGSDVVAITMSIPSGIMGNMGILGIPDAIALTTASTTNAKYVGVYFGSSANPALIWGGQYNTFLSSTYGQRIELSNALININYNKQQSRGVSTAPNYSSFSGFVYGLTTYGVDTTSSTLVFQMTVQLTSAANTAVESVVLGRAYFNFERGSN
jgi:hypothetical protein